MLDRPWINPIFSLGKYILINSVHKNYNRTVYDVHELHAFKYVDDKKNINIHKRDIHSRHVLQLHSIAQHIITAFKVDYIVIDFLFKK